MLGATVYGELLSVDAHIVIVTVIVVVIVVGVDGPLVTVTVVF